MNCINTTFAHGNGPYSRMVEWGIEVNNMREEKGMKRLPIIIPLVYPGRQERIIKEEIKNNISEDFLEKYPYEIFFDTIQGKLLNELMFKGKDYSENLDLLCQSYYSIENKLQKHLDGKRILKDFDSKNLIEFDLRDCEFQLGLNNRIQTGIPIQFYTAGGAGPFDEILGRALVNKEIKHNKEIIKKTIPISKRMIENQKIIFSNDPGVFSYDSYREKRNNEIYTPSFIHPPKKDTTDLPGKGIYLMMTGIDGVRESGMYDAVGELGMKIFVPKFSINNLPEKIKSKAILLSPNKINNPKVIAQYARSGWSSVWLSHLAEKGFITPPYQETDDPEIYFNNKGIERLGLGAIMGENPKSALEKAIDLAENVGKFNKNLISKYGTLDGIKYSAKIVVDYLEKNK